jgi:hypothetical protein
VRIFVPATSTLLRQLVDDRELAASPIRPLVAFGVTDGLRAHYSDDDDEESLEYAAQTEAARASLRLLEADDTALRRRVVIAAEIDPSSLLVRDDVDRGVVHVGQPVPFSAVVSVHVDDPAAEPIVALAATSMLAADIGDEVAQDAVDDAEGFELGWYATQEIGTLLDLA